jgi:hypothetical protein
MMISRTPSCAVVAIALLVLACTTATGECWDLKQFGCSRRCHLKHSSHCGNPHREPVPAPSLVFKQLTSPLDALQSRISHYCSSQHRPLCAVAHKPSQPAYLPTRSTMSDSGLCCACPLNIYSSERAGLRASHAIAGICHVGKGLR